MQNWPFLWTRAATMQVGLVVGKGRETIFPTRIQLTGITRLLSPTHPHTHAQYLVNKWTLYKSCGYEGTLQCLNKSGKGFFLASTFSHSNITLWITILPQSPNAESKS